MNATRARAYRRVMQTLAEEGPANKLLPSELEQIRHAADELIFSSDLADDAPASEALDEVGRLCRRLVESERWDQAAASRLAKDIARCGPAGAPELMAA